MKAGYLKLERVEPSTVPRSQKALLARRRHLWGRLLVMRMMRVPVPRFIGFALFRSWLRLSATHKLRSLLGTFKRIVLRGWTRPLKAIVSPDGPPDAGGAQNSPVDLKECESRCKV
jgi:coenzyme F420 hydrogenase subunit beta